MFDFWKEVIINSNVLPVEEGVDENGAQFKRFSALNGNIFRVLRCADYKSDNVVNKEVHYTAGRVGAPASVEMDFAGLAEGVYRILVDLSLENRYYSDYAYPWSEFHKPIMVEFEVAGDVVAAEAAMKSLKKAIPTDYKFVHLVLNGDVVKMTCSDPHMVIKSAKLQMVEADPCLDGCSNMQYSDVKVFVPVKNVAPFATGEWLVENLRFPTYPNLRYAAVNSDETPIAGALYHQYTFGYCIERRGLTGQGAVGQMLSSVTHHVFYVLDAYKDEFEAAIKDAGLTIVGGGDNAPEDGEDVVSGSIELYFNNDKVDAIRVAQATVEGDAGIVVEANLVDVTGVPTWKLTGNAAWQVMPAEDGNSAELDMPGATVGDKATLTVSVGEVSKTVSVEII